MPPTSLAATYLAGRKLRPGAWGRLITRHLKADSLPQLDTWDEVRRFAASYPGIKREDARAVWSAYARTKQKLARRAEMMEAGQAAVAQEGGILG